MQLTSDIAPPTPRTTFITLPHPQLAAKAHTRSNPPVDTGAYVMAAQGMHLLQRLDQWVRMLVFGCISMDDLALGALDLDRRGARGGQKLRGRDGEGEDVGGVGAGDGVGLEVLFGL